MAHMSGMNKIMLTPKRWCLLIGASLCILGAAFNAGFFIGKESHKCQQRVPYELPESTGGIMLIVPEGWYAIPILNKYNRPWKRPTDEEG